MPYIKEVNRKKLDHLINDIICKLDLKFNVENRIDVGELNYIISKIIWTMFKRHKSYRTANDLIGVLECIKLEFYSRQVSNYEDVKKIENGDVICDV